MTLLTKWPHVAFLKFRNLNLPHLFKVIHLPHPCISTLRHPLCVRHIGFSNIFSCRLTVSRLSNPVLAFVMLNYNPDKDLPSLDGKVIFLTGGLSSID